MDQEVTSRTKQKIEKVLEVLRTDLGTIRSSRATPALVENLVIPVYGGSTKMRVVELATIASSDAQTLVLTPFDQSIINEIQKGIQDASTGLTPVVDGQIVRITMPQLSEERRQELIKLMKHKLENGRIMVRQVRHEEMSEIKKLVDAKEISEDDQHRLEKEVQKAVDEATEMIEHYGKQKEEELLSI